MFNSSRFQSATKPTIVIQNTILKLVCLCVLVGAISCSSTHKKEVDLIINVGLLFDGKTGETNNDRAIVIHEGRIQRITSIDSVAKNYTAPKIIDAMDKFVMPTLFDTHSHTSAFVDTIETVEGVPTVRVFSDGELTKWDLRMMLYQGITWTRDLGGFPEMMLEMKNKEKEQRIPSPRILTCSKLMSEPPLVFPAMVQSITSEEQARAYVREMHAIGVDYIKLLFNLRPEFSRAAIDEAHRLGLKVAGHLNRTSWSEALEMGIDVLVHAPYGNEPMMDLESEHVSTILATMAGKGIPNDPTLAMRYGYHTDHAFERNSQLPEVYASAPKQMKKMWHMLSAYKKSHFKANPEMAEYHSNFVRKAHEAGVVLSTSSDTWTSWTDYGNTIHNEMRLLAEAGIPENEVLLMATRNGAYQLNLLNDFGTLEEGKVADILILERNPLSDISNTRSIHTIIKDGATVQRSSLLKQLTP